MAAYEKQGGHVEYYTPKYIFDALNVGFDLDVAHPNIKTHVPAKRIITENSLEENWEGFIWMNPPYLNEKSKHLWVDKFLNHGNGIALMPDRTSAGWWQKFAQGSSCHMFVKDKIKFELADGSIAKSPGNGSTLFACGQQAIWALLHAEKHYNLGNVYSKW